LALKAPPSSYTNRVLRKTSAENGGSELKWPCVMEIIRIGHQNRSAVDFRREDGGMTSEKTMAKNHRHREDVGGI